MMLVQYEKFLYMLFIMVGAVRRIEERTADWNHAEDPLPLTYSILKQVLSEEIRRVDDYVLLTLASSIVLSVGVC